VKRADFSNNFPWDGTLIVMDFRDGQQRGLGVDAALVVRWSNATHDFVAASRPGGYALSHEAR
jgi:hypothetical protein